MNAPAPAAPRVQATEVPVRCAVKPAKVAVSVDLGVFPWASIPPPGTPGAKAMSLSLDLDSGDAGVLRVTLKVPPLQQLVKTVAATDTTHGGFVLVQGRLFGNEIREAGAIFQAHRALAADKAADTGAQAA